MLAIFYHSAKKRVPAWCDRILWQIHDDAFEKITISADLVEYKSIPSYVMSDHKPVTATFNIKVSSGSSKFWSLVFISLSLSFFTCILLFFSTDCDWFLRNSMAQLSYWQDLELSSISYSFVMLHKFFVTKVQLQIPRTWIHKQSTQKYFNLYELVMDE